MKEEVLAFLLNLSIHGPLKSKSDILKSMDKKYASLIVVKTTKDNETAIFSLSKSGKTFISLFMLSIESDFRKVKELEKVKKH